MKKILSLDGGGIKGIVIASVLVYLEEQLRIKTKNKDARIADFFDLVAGTSTGGILAAFLLHPDKSYTAQKALDFYVHEGYNIFEKSRYKGYALRQAFNGTKISPKYLEGLFEKVFGDLKIKDLIKPCIITAYDLITKQPVFFKQHKNGNVLVKKAVRSTSAAPTFFPPNKHDNMICVDGGLFANNPSMCCYSEASKLWDVDQEEILMFSIGAGNGNYKVPNLKKYKNWGLLNWAKTVPEICMDGALDTVEFQMNQLFRNTDNRERSSIPKEAQVYSPDMSDGKKENIELLLLAGKMTVESNKKQIDSFIDKLITK